LLRFSIISFIALVSELKGTDYILFGDSQFNFHLSRNAFMAYLAFFDATLKTSLHPGVYGYNVLVWFYGMIYHLCGYSPFLILLFNATAGCLAAWMVYLITCRITKNRTTAAWAMGFTIFWPSQILWSVELLKEPMLILLISVIIYLFVEMIERKKWYNIFFLGLLWYPLGHIRMNMHLLVLVTLVLSSVLCLPRKVWTRLLLLVVLAGGITAAAGPSRLKNMYNEYQSLMITMQIGFVSTGGSYYRFIPERYIQDEEQRTPMTFREIVGSYLKALYFYLGVPNPFARLGMNKLPVLPQMLGWYIMLILFFPVGLLYLLRYHFRSAGIIFVYLFVVTSAAALFTGNEGTAFRHRDILTPFYFIPIAVGMVNLLGWLAKGYRRSVELACSGGRNSLGAVIPGC